MKKRLLRFANVLLLPLLFLLLMAVSMNGRAQTSTATVTTDKADYYPGETITFTGGGWLSGETVELYIEHQFYLDHNDQIINVVADSNGDIYDASYVVDESDLGEIFWLTATGLTSNRKAYAEFTDSPKVGSVSVGTQTPNPVVAGNSAVYQITVNRGSGNGSNGSFTANLSITTSLPTGASATFSPNPVSFGSSDNTKTANLTITTNATTTPAASTSFTVRAFTSASDAAITSGTLIVNSKDPVITWSNPDDITYGTALSSTQLNATANVAGTFTYTPAAGAKLNAGDGQILHVEFTPTDPSYMTVSKDVTINVAKKAATVVADSQSKLYGEDNPTLTAVVTGAVTGGDPVNYSLSTTAAKLSGIGAYPIEVTLGSNPNYDVTPTNNTLTVGQRPITITADAKGKTYGDTDPALTAQVTVGTIVTGDVAFGSLKRAAGENVGSYAISKGTYTYGTNYNETFVGANLVIGQRPITITADANSKYIGQVDPALTYQITSGSLVSGENFTGSLLRSPGECAGIYAINQGPLTLTTNYILTYVPANFTINGVTIDASQSSTPIPVGTIATLYAKVTPAIPGITVTFTLDNGTTAIFPTYTGSTDINGIAKATVPNLPVEVYKVTALVGNCVSSTAAYLAVYDPNGGFVTGGGWINSPAGAYTANPTLTGKANFGFNSKYEKGKTTPTGNTEFQFQAGNLNFSSSTYNVGSLVISGSKATYKGTGTIKGLSGTFAFMVSAVDGDVTGGGGIDKFRIKIWNGNTVIYDNNLGADENDLPTTALGGGSIVIHEVKNKAAFIPVEVPVVAVEPTIKAYPNPFTERLNIEFSSANDTQAKLEIFSVTGAKLATLWDAPVSGGVLNKVEYVPNLVSSQMVFYHLTMNGKTQVGKVVFQERR